MVEKTKEKGSINYAESITVKRAVFIKKYNEEIKMKRLTEKARRSGIRASSEPNKSRSLMSPPPPLDFKRLLMENPSLVGSHS